MRYIIAVETSLDVKFIGPFSQNIGRKFEVKMEQNDSTVGEISGGKVIIKENSSSQYAYVLKDGKAKVLKNVDGRQLLIGTINKGEVFGEMAFFGETKRTASVIADGDVKVEMISRQTFMDFLDTLPLEIRNKMHALISNLTNIAEINRRLAILFQNIQDVETRTTNAKVFEIETMKMPEFIRHVSIAIAERLHAEIIRLNKLTTRVEDTFKTADSLVITTP